MKLRKTEQKSLREIPNKQKQSGSRKSTTHESKGEGRRENGTALPKTAVMHAHTLYIYTHTWGDRDEKRGKENDVTSERACKK